MRPEKSIASVFLCFVLIGSAMEWAAACPQGQAVDLKQQQPNLSSSKEKLPLVDGTVRIVETPWKFFDAQTKSGLRGLAVYNKDIMWASGSGGTIVNTFDQGKTWRTMVIKGAEALDFRDIHVIDDATVIAMSSGTPTRIYRTTNAGISWKSVYESNDPKVFLDSISFLNEKTGIAMGDPVNGQLFLLRTDDSGMTWQPVAKTPKLENGEAGFAASGTNMASLGGRRIWIGLGGGNKPDTKTKSRVLLTNDSLNEWKVASTPLPRFESGGIFSLLMINDSDGVVVGGDYKATGSTEGTFAVTNDGGSTWNVPKKSSSPTGFRSCVSLWRKDKELQLVAVGTNGTDLSKDLGTTWNRVSNEGFNAVQFSDDGKTGWAVGADGRVAKWLGAK